MIRDASAATFSSDVLENDGKTVVQFHATWCGPCKALAPHFAAAAERAPDLNWVRVDVDDLDTEVLKSYNILSVPTVKVFENGGPTKDIKARTVLGILEEVR